MFGDILECDVCVEDVLRFLFPVGAVVPFDGDEEEGCYAAKEEESPTPIAFLEDSGVAGDDR
jgi:hypothetical protein